MWNSTYLTPVSDQYGSTDWGASSPDIFIRSFSCAICLELMLYLKVEMVTQVANKERVELQKVRWDERASLMRIVRKE